MDITLASVEERIWALITDFAVALSEFSGKGAALARQGMRQLVLAESMMRRLIYLRALRLGPPPPPAARPVSSSAPGKTAPVPASPPQRPRPALPRFRLIEPALRPAGADPASPPRLPEALCPRLTVMDASARPGRPAPKPPRPKPDLQQLFTQRYLALTDAFVRTDAYARQMARWIARQETGPAPARAPFRPAHFPAQETPPEESPLRHALFAADELVRLTLAPDTG